MICGDLASRCVKALAHSIGDLCGLDQKRCAICLQPFFAHELGEACSSTELCPACQKDVPPFTGVMCAGCGLPLSCSHPGASRKIRRLCRECCEAPPPWQGWGFYGLYDGKLRELVLRFKFGHDQAMRSVFGQMLAEASICMPRPDLIVAVPQHASRLAARGYNQAHEIAKALSCQTGFPTSSKVLARTRAGRPQEELSAVKRRENMRHAFAATSAASSRKIWLVDDVMTTGSTCKAATEALLKAGALEVYVLTVARTPI